MAELIHVQFADESATRIVAAFGCTQDATLYPNCTAIVDTDPRWAVFYESMPEIAKAGLPSPA